MVVFRDGVGDPQMQVVKETEVVLIKEAFSEISEKYTPGFSFVIVQKRISTRIFQYGGGSQGIVNAAPGTIVDRIITKRGFLDFYLVSQHVRQGTVTPTRYVVIENTPGFSSSKPFSIDDIQKSVVRRFLITFFSGVILEKIRAIASIYFVKMAAVFVFFSRIPPAYCEKNSQTVLLAKI